MQTQTSKRLPIIEVYLPDTNGHHFRTYRKALRIAQTLTNLGMLKTYKVPILYISGCTIYQVDKHDYVDNIEIIQEGTKFLVYGDVSVKDEKRVLSRDITIDDKNNFFIVTVIAK